ncbi:MAG: ATP-binding cassette domain-containing protein [Flavobacteriales bacterium]|nr:ATP-binding cassette domain-containing protein [Flavobacteriales bacterium]
MWIELHEIGKIYREQVVFKNISKNFSANTVYGIKGSNGSGKSTLIKIISGYLNPSKGHITSSHKDYSHDIAYCAPYIKPIQELTLKETFNLHSNIDKRTISYDEFEEMLKFPFTVANKQLSEFSSGMQQKALLGLAILSSKSLLLLDEPCSNLDTNAIDWYNSTLEKHKKDRIIIIASNNQQVEMDLAEEFLEIENYKK